MGRIGLMLRGSLGMMLVGLVLLAYGTLAGCSPESLIPARVPAEVQKKLALEKPTVPYSEFRDVMDRYRMVVQDELDALAAKAKATAARMNKSIRSTTATYQQGVARLTQTMEAEVKEIELAAGDELAAIQLELERGVKVRDGALARGADEEKKAQEKVDSLNSMVGGIVGMAAPGVQAAFPAAGPLVSLGLAGITGVLGWRFMRKPGDQKQLDDAKALAEKREAELRAEMAVAVEKARGEGYTQAQLEGVKAATV